jgi:predicted ArsR family transcriptional regulator
MRPPSVFVRPLAPAEGQRLKRLSRQAKHASTRQRAAILLASATEMSAREIAEMWMTDESHVRKVIHDFNEHGFASRALVSGAGDPAGSRLTTRRGSSRSPAPVPTRSGCH